MIGPDSVLERAPDVRYRQVDDETVLIRQSAGEAWVLNEVAGRIVDLVDGERTIAQVLKALTDEYDASEDAIKGDLESYLGELLESGALVLPAPNDGSND